MTRVHLSSHILTEEVVQRAFALAEAITGRTMSEHDVVASAHELRDLCIQLQTACETCKGSGLDVAGLQALVATNRLRCDTCNERHDLMRCKACKGTGSRIEERFTRFLDAWERTGSFPAACAAVPMDADLDVPVAVEERERRGRGGR